MKTKERYISKKHRHDITSEIPNDSSSVDKKKTREKEDIVTNIIILIIKLIEITKGEDMTVTVTEYCHYISLPI